MTALTLAPLTLAPNRLAPNRLAPNPGSVDPDALTVVTPCRSHDPDLWFAERPDDVVRAQALCRGCPLRLPCLTGALERAEPWGVWGGELFERGAVVARKRPRGRPRQDDHQTEAAALAALERRLADVRADRSEPDGLSA